MSRKESSDRTSTAPTSPTVPEHPPTMATKLCHIIKRPDFDGYGFNLHSEKAKPGQYIGKVDPNSPAEEAGLKECDRIIEVNGVPINNETHKQVVQRIKAIACEVRLLLIDADGKGSSSTAPSAVVESTSVSNKSDIKSEEEKTGSSNVNGNDTDYHGTMQEIPGSSANISSISMISTKRMSDSSNRSNNNNSDLESTPTGNDVTDKAANASQNNINMDIPEQSSKNVSKSPAAATENSNIKTPPPPSITAATVLPTSSVSSTSSSNNSNGNINKSGSLQLPMTAAEMRAKLLSKKKYDPKNESVDLKKKFEIIQKL